MISKFHNSFRQPTILFLIFGCVIFLLLNVSCRKQTAQLPANKTLETDSTEIKLLELNKRITQLEDSAIVAFLALQPGSYTKANAGFWYHIQQTGGSGYVVDDSVAVFSYTAFTLEGTQVMHEELKTIHFGKKEAVTGLEEGLKLLKHGGKARFIVPWYLAYGSLGSGKIKPYTTLIYEVEVHE